MEQQQIYDTKDFPFPRVSLGKPFNKHGMYLIKMYVGESPIFIQPPKCVVKQAVMKSGKKIFCDLVFSMENGHFLTWLEKIEEIAKQKIFENRAAWFETELDEHDIENSLVSPYKMYKSGKFFIIRANFPTTLGKCDLKIYDENENVIPHEDLKEDTEVITIVELKGIKCSARSFQFEFDVRQMLVVSPEKLFEKCIIKKNTGATTPATPVLSKDDDAKNEQGRASYPQNATTGACSGLDANISHKIHDEPNASLGQTANSEIDNERNETEHPTPRPVSSIKTPDADNARQPTLVPRVGAQPFSGEDSPLKMNSNSENNRIESPPKKPEETPEICEIDFDLAELEKNEVVQLKPRNDVYYKMYKEVKRKAKEAKMIALSNYLEAKRLKTTYLLEDSSDSSDYDTETETAKHQREENDEDDDE
jgi:hypothetical protein